MGAIFTAAFEDVSVTAAQDFFELLAGSANPCEIRRVRLSSGKLTSEAVRITINRITGSPTSGSGGSTPTIRKTSTTFGSATATVEANNTSRNSGGTKETLYNEEWNWIVPFEWVPQDDKGQSEIPAGKYFTVGLEAAPGASTKVSGWIEWEEKG